MHPPPQNRAAGAETRLLKHGQQPLYRLPAPFGERRSLTAALTPIHRLIAPLQGIKEPGNNSQPLARRTTAQKTYPQRGVGLIEIDELSVLDSRKTRTTEVGSFLLPDRCALQQLCKQGCHGGRVVKLLHHVLF